MVQTKVRILIITFLISSIGSFISFFTNASPALSSTTRIEAQTQAANTSKDADKGTDPEPVYRGGSRR